MKCPGTKERKIDYLFLKPSTYCFKHFWPFLVISLLLCFPLTKIVDDFFSTSVIFRELYNSYPSFDTSGTVIAVYVFFMGLVYLLLYKLSKYIVQKKRNNFKDYYFSLEESGVSANDEEYQFCASAWSLSQEVEQLRKNKAEGKKSVSTNPELDCFTKDAFKYAWKYRRGRVISIPIVSVFATAIYTLVCGFAGMAILAMDYLFMLAFLFLALYIFTALQMEKKKETHWELVRLMKLLNMLYFANGEMGKARSKRKEIEKNLEAMI